MRTVAGNTALTMHIRTVHQPLVPSAPYPCLNVAMDIMMYCTVCMYSTYLKHQSMVEYFILIGPRL